MLHSGWHFPDADRDAHGVILRDAEPDTKALLGFVKGRKCVIQAGANVGVYPARLAGLFEEVFTVEPDPANYECLHRNMLARDLPNVFYRHAAFGEDLSSCSIDHMNPRNCGAHRIAMGGEIPVVTIDDLNASPDLIWLDVEGYELPALKGASETIRRCKPIIACEEKGLGGHFGIATGEIENYLAAFGYRKLANIGRDCVYGT